MSVSDFEVLKVPIHLQRGNTLRQRRFRLAPDFRWDTRLSAIYGDAPGITIEDVELIGADRWEQRWFDLSPKSRVITPGIPTELVGIRLQGCPRLRIDRVKVRGFPRPAIETIGIDDSWISNLEVERCFQGLNVRGYKPNRRVRIEHVRVRDTWGPPFKGKWPGIGGPPSKRPGEFMGSDGLVLGNLSDSSLSDIHVLGEQLLGIKLGGSSRNVDISTFVGSGFMVQGTDTAVTTQAPTVGITLRNSVIDKDLGSGPHAAGGNAVQVSFHVHGFRLLDSQLRGRGKNGNAIEFATDVHGEVRNCSISGFNGMRGGNPCHAISLWDGSTVNDDFETVNQFTDQQRIKIVGGTRKK